MGKRSLDDIFNNDPLGLLNVEPKEKSQHKADSFLVNGFKDILRFYEENGKAPQHDESSSIDELRLAKRLETFRNNPKNKKILMPYDKYDLLSLPNEIYEAPPASIDEILDSELLTTESDSIFNLKHVEGKSQSVNEYTASRKPCKDFSNFQKIFQKVQLDLDKNILTTCPIEKIANIKAGEWFIVQGMLAYVAEMGEKYEHRKGHHNARLRVIFSNKTESNLLLRSFGAALYKDKSARRIIAGDDKLHDSTDADVNELPSGTVYVLKSLCQQAGIREHREYLHKIGVTSGDVKSRIVGAEKDPTYLLAAVEVVGEFKLFHMDIKATEKLLHKFFQDAQAEIEIKDRFGNIVKPREWFFVTVKAIQDAVRALQANQLLEYRYDAKSGMVIKK